MFWDDIVADYWEEMKKEVKDRDWFFRLFDIPCFDVNNIHEWMEGDVKSRMLPDATPLAPPFSAWFMEFRQKGFTLGVTVGVLPLIEEIKNIFDSGENKGVLITDEKFAEAMEKIGENSFKAVVGSGEYVYRVDCYIKGGNGREIRKINPTFFADKTLTKHIVMDSEPKAKNEYGIMANSFCILIYNFLLLLSAKNITVQVFRKPSEEINKKREKGGKLPLFTYKMLTIDPDKVSREFLPKMTDGGLKSLRLHLCRGHIKRYTEESPLFGKYTGAWFWSPMMRGKKELGEVKKGYKVEAPEINPKG